jgi:hypothetical protein
MSKISRALILRTIVYEVPRTPRKIDKMTGRFQMKIELQKIALFDHSALSCWEMKILCDTIYSWLSNWINAGLIHIRSVISHLYSLLLLEFLSSIFILAVAAATKSDFYLLPASSTKLSSHSEKREEKTPRFTGELFHIFNTIFSIFWQDLFHFFSYFN